LIIGSLLEAALAGQKKARSSKPDYLSWIDHTRIATDLRQRRRWPAGRSRRGQARPWRFWAGAS